MKKCISPKKYLALLLIAAVGSGCSGGDDKKTEPAAQQTAAADSSGTAQREITLTADQFRLSEIGLGSIAQRSLSDIIKLNGMVEAEPSSVASVSAPLGGYIRTAGKLPGEFVKKGALLATLENPEFVQMQQEYLESRGRLEFLEQEYRRQQQLRAEDVNSAKTFQQVSSDYKVIRARISGLQQQLALAGISADALEKSGRISRTANIYSPISGYIKASNTNIGKYAAPTDVLFEIVGNEELHLALNAFEKDLGRITVGQTVKFSKANETGYERTAKVFLVGRASGADKTIPVHCHLQGREGLLPGMYVKAWVETGSRRQDAVPDEAIVQLEGIDYIITVASQDAKGYRFRLVQVARGQQQEGFTAISLPSDIEIASLKVVTKNAYTILSAIKNAEEEE